MSLEIILFSKGLRLCYTILKKKKKRRERRGCKKKKDSSVLAETMVHLQYKLLSPLTQNVCCDTT